MDLELLDCLNQPEKVAQLLKYKKSNEIFCLIDNILNSDSDPVNCNLLEALFWGVTEHEQLLEIYEHVVDVLWLKQVTEDRRHIISTFLDTNLGILEDWKLERLCFRIIQKLKTPCSEGYLLFDIIAKVIVKLERSDVVLNSMIDSLCSSDWVDDNVGVLLEKLGGYPLNTQSKEKVLKKVLRVLNPGFGQYSSLIHKTIAFSFPTNLPYMLHHLCMNISRNSEDGSSKDFAGYAIFSIYSLAKQNEKFGEAVLNTIKNSLFLNKMPEFFYTVLLTLLPIRTFQQRVSQLLTSSILSSFSDNQLISESSFLRDLQIRSDNPNEVILKLSERCTSDQWNFIVHGMILLGFTLLRAVSSCTSNTGFKITRSSRSTKSLILSPFLDRYNLKSRVLRSGLDLLTYIFKNCHSSRNEIMTITSSLMWSESSRPTAMYAVDLLADLVAVCPFEVAIRSNCLDPIIDSIGLIPLNLSTSLIHALLPLLRAGTLLENYCLSEGQNKNNPFAQVRVRLLANLCKAASSPQIQSRRTAVACFMLLLKHLKVSISAFRSASQYSSSSSLSQPFLNSQSQSTQKNPLILFSQLQSTQVAQEAVLLPCDLSQNEILCTEIISMLHRIIFSAFFRSQSGNLLMDPENIVKSDIYWGLCEVVTRNRGLCEPVLSLYLRLLTGCLSSSFLKSLKNSNILQSLTIPGNIGSSHTTAILNPAFNLNQLIDSYSKEAEIKRTEHPDILIWCLQLILTLPIFNSLWRRFRQTYSNNQDVPSVGSESSESISSNSMSQFTQSSLAVDSIQCGRSVSYSLFSKAVNLLICLCNSLRMTPKEDFGVTGDIDLSNTINGKLNRERVQLLLSIYDACLEFELKNPIENIRSTNNLSSQVASQVPANSSWSRIRQLFARRLCLYNLLCSKNHTQSAQMIAQGSVLLTATQRSSDSRIGLLTMSLVSISQVNLQSVLLESVKSDSANSLANHLLHTIFNRLDQFTRSTEVDIPCAYRDTLVEYTGALLKHVIRYYHHKLAVESESTTSSVTNPDSCANTSQLLSSSADIETNEESNNSRLPNGVSSTSALNVFNVGLTLTLHHLGSKRLHNLCKILYPTVNNPAYSESLLNPEDDEKSALDDESSESIDVTPAQALSCLIKLLKSWITKILNPFSGNSSKNSIVPKITSQNCSYSKDLVILLPLLVKLCRARACLGSEIVNPETYNLNPYAGLDRVLAWLIRLMKFPSNHPKSARSEHHYGTIVTPARVQLTNQALWLSHLVGPNIIDHNEHNMDSDLAIDDLLLVLTTDINTVLGNLSEAVDISYLPEDPEGKIEYAVVTRSSALSLLPLIFTFLKQSLTEYEWLLNHLTIDYGGRLDPNNEHQKVNDTALKLEGNNKEEAFCFRLIGFGEILAQILKTALPAPSTHVDSLLEIGARIFNLLGQTTKYYLRIIRLRYGRFPIIFERVVRVFGRKVSPRAYALFSYIQNAEAEKVKAFQENKNLKKKSNEKVDGTDGIRNKLTKKQTNLSSLPQTLVSRSIKDSRLIPQLIFAIEQYERFLMQLSKASKINLMRNVKLSMSRDFRINPATVVAQLERSTAFSPGSDSDDSNDDVDIDGVENVESRKENTNINPNMNNHSDIILDRLETRELSSSFGNRQSEMVVSTQNSNLEDPNSSRKRYGAENDASCESKTKTPTWGRYVNPITQRRSTLKRELSATDTNLSSSKPKILKQNSKNNLQ